jgi:hypothetical protein
MKSCLIAVGSGIQKAYSPVVTVVFSGWEPKAQAMPGCIVVCIGNKVTLKINTV